MQHEETMIRENWNKIKDNLRFEFEINDVPFRTWIEPLNVYSYNNGVLTIELSGSIDNDLAKNYIRKNYEIFLKTSISMITGMDVELEFEPSSRLAQNHPEEAVAETPPLSSVNESSEEFLDPKFTFENFVSDKTNEMAQQACLAVAEQPGTYNPLFIYGGVGLGKTHLMKSIRNYVLTNLKDKKVLYVTSETFTNEFIDILRTKSDMSAFRNKYRNIDVLLIDDIQFISNKESTSEEFFHTFNALFDNKKQIVISSDKPPIELSTLEKRLTTRFSEGLVVDVKSPTYETRMAILKKKCETDEINISEDVLDYIANSISSNIRELEGALTRIIAISNFRHINITREMAIEELKDMVAPDEKRAITIDYIISVVAEHFHITVEDIVSNKRTQEIAHPRQICMYLCKQIIPNSTHKEIGEKLGKKDHSTIIHGVNKIDKDIKNDPNVYNEVENLRKKLNS